VDVAQPTRVATPSARRELPAILRALPLLSPSLLWLGIFYLVPLGILLLHSVWSTDTVNMVIVHQFTLSSYQSIATDPMFRNVALRTMLMAVGVTVTDIALAFPIAYLIAFRLGRLKTLAFMLVLVPLWSSYLIRAYAWKSILGLDGVLNSFLVATHILSRPSPAFLYSNLAMFITFTHVWLPFMILPVYTALEKIPRSLLEAAGDLGAPGWRTFLHVVLPLSVPGIVAGAIATFSLTMGDYITPQLLGGPDSQLVGNVIASQFGVTFNWPLGAAFSAVVLVIVAVFLGLANRAGAAGTAR
jgi:ABC-type spermidine/putrescine transport system permease subunit I